jgi:hypothetical protein
MIRFVQKNECVGSFCVKLSRVGGSACGGSECWMLMYHVVCYFAVCRV